MITDHDVVVFGAGLAGMRAALEASRSGADVAVISKVHPIRSHSNADQDAVEIMCREAPSDIIELEHMGVIFYRGDDGKLGTRAFGGASVARTYFVGDITGQALLNTLYDQIMKAGVKVYEEWFATSLWM